MGSSSGSLRPARRLPEGPRLRAGWSSWEAGRESFCRGTGCALLPCPPDEGEDTVATNQPAKRSLAAGLLALLRPPNVFTAIADPFAGLVLARPPGPVSGVLALAILLYDALLKGTKAGFLTMGVCRGLNFSLPMSLAMKSVPGSLFFAPALLAAYISVLTYLAHEEVGGNTLERAHHGVTAMAVVALVMGVAIAPWPAAPVGWAFLALVVVRC